MSIFIFEIKAQLKNTVIWILSILAVLLLFMAVIYPVFEGSLEEVVKMIEGFPPEFTAAFGFDVTSMFSIGGFYGFAFAYISLIGAIMAVSLSVSAFSREKRSKSTDFLLTKPVGRGRIFMEKLLSGFGILLVTNGIYIAACYWVLRDGVPEVELLFLSGLALLLTQLAFFGIGVLFAVWSKKVRSVSGVATAVGFGAFILSALINIMKDDKIRYIAPLKYFDPTALFQNGSYELRYAMVGVTVTGICLVAAFALFCKRDAHAV